eukprot:CAMPEP_0113850480 /NCGR_PEP_ID=MMETSP0372-20130328/3914_1 /TAXON_ID=340204 /ORGANISM="Lankesteria abbotti" /LENGTH=815 /DNA_ID=CAMNT_0000820795 /DNA_START=610 /DNA_END=3057 /DNA_ORIENTATION=- /assembly_acc=CAM_ASM_000359
MKRVSIAIELLDNPQLLLLDEPTSGLDSSLALEVMQVLVNLARAGRTVIITIHQPRSQVFSMIDSVVLVNKGRLVYNGPPDVIRPQFQSWGYPCPLDWNPADFVLDLISSKSAASTKLLSRSDLDVENDVESPTVSPGDGLGENHFVLSDQEIQDLPDRWNESEAQRAINEDAEHIANHPGVSPAPAGATRFGRTDVWKYWHIHFTALYVRFTRNSLRNPITCFVMLMIHVIQGCILGGVFKGIGYGVIASPVSKTVEPPTWLNATWLNIYAFGVDGAGYRPLVNVFSDGPSGQGSDQLLAFFSDEANLQYAHGVIECSYEKYGLMDTRPTYPPSDFTAPSTWPEQSSGRLLQDVTQFRNDVVTMIKGVADGSIKIGDPDGSAASDTVDHDTVDNRDPEVFEFDAGFKELALSIYEMSPSVVGVRSKPRFMQAASVSTTSPTTTPFFYDAEVAISDLTKLLQLVDFFVLRVDYERASQCLQYNDPLPFYVCIMTHADYILNPLLQCLGFPLLPGQQITSSVSRMLSPSIPGIRPRHLQTTAESTLGPDFSDVLNATDAIITQLSSCSNALCQSLSSSLDYLSGLLSDLANTLFIVLNVTGSLFFSVANLGFACYDALLTFPAERAVFNHETANGLYGVTAYYLAKNLADLPFQLLPSMALSMVYYWLVDLAPTASQFFIYVAVCATVTFASYGFGYMISAGSPRMEIAVIIAPLTLILWFVLAGFLLRDPDIPAWIAWFRYFSVYRWGFFSFLNNEFPPGTWFNRMPSTVILALVGVTETRLWFTSMITVVLGVGYRFAGFFLLKFTNRKVGIER